MHRIDTPTAQVDKFGAGKNGFTRGNPQTGVPTTALDDDYFDSVQEELAGVIEGAGIVLNKANRAQLLAALKKLFLQSGNNLSEIKNAGQAAVAQTLANLGIQEASLKNAGLVRLSDNVGSTDTTLAATINSVTYTFGQAQSKMSKGSNGADIPDKAAFRLALQLGAAALLGVGTRDDIPAGSTSLLATMDCLASLIPKRSYSANDYIRIPDVPRGLMIQWGYFSSGQGVNFPTPFSVDCLTVLQIPQSAD
ncbi:tail fiber protein, partial [Yersinia ruckeri]